MVSSTARYRFEFRLLEWAEGASRSFCGERRALFVGFRKGGEVARRVYLGDAGATFEGERKAQLVDAHPSWFLFVPSSESGTGYLEWLGVHQKVAERWLGGPLEREDFLDVRGSGARDEWPVTWRVLIG